MQRISEEILSKCRSLLEDGTADRVMGWENGEFCYDVTPAIFTKDTLENMIYDDFCAANQSKYLIAESKKDGKVIALLTPYLTRRRSRQKQFRIRILATGSHISKILNI